MELPTSHRVPLGWLLEHGSESIRFRVYRDLVDPGAIPPETLQAAQEGVEASKPVQAIVKKQKETGLWGGNFVGLAPSAKDGIKDVGTVPQYRRLLELGYRKDGRPFRLAERVMYRMLSRDEDPALQFEFSKVAKAGLPAEEWIREHFREAALASLAEGGHIEDPRVRGAAHKLASEVSQFLRSPLAEKPFARSGAKAILDPEAHPPTWYSMAMLAAMPNLQRERAGFTERLSQFLSVPAPKKTYTVQVGKKSLKPDFVLLGNPIEADAKGQPKDIPLALLFLELMVKLDALRSAPLSVKVLNRLLADCDERGVWRPKGLKTLPRAPNKHSYHSFPLQAPSKSPESRMVDVTFRLSLIAKLAGWHLEYV